MLSPPPLLEQYICNRNGVDTLWAATTSLPSGRGHPDRCSWQCFKDPRLSVVTRVVQEGQSDEPALDQLSSYLNDILASVVENQESLLFFSPTLLCVLDLSKASPFLKQLTPSTVLRCVRDELSTRLPPIAEGALFLVLPANDVVFAVWADTLTSRFMSIVSEPPNQEEKSVKRYYAIAADKNPDWRGAFEFKEYTGESEPPQPHFGLVPLLLASLQEVLWGAWADKEHTSLYVPVPYECTEWCRLSEEETRRLLATGQLPTFARRSSQITPFTEPPLSEDMATESASVDWATITALPSFNGGNTSITAATTLAPSSQITSHASLKMEDRTPTPFKSEDVDDSSSSSSCSAQDSVCNEGVDQVFPARFHQNPRRRPLEVSTPLGDDDEQLSPERLMKMFPETPSSSSSGVDDEKKRKCLGVLFRQKNHCSAK